MNHDNIINSIFKICINNPDFEAIRYGGISITYDNLKTHICEIGNKVAGLHDEIIGVIDERNPSTILTLLGIFCSRNSYLPISSNISDDKLKLILSESNTKVIFVSSLNYQFWAKKINSLFGDNIKVIPHEINNNTGKNITSEKITIQDLSPKKAAYILFTSGTTGNPKGVVIEHGNLQNLIKWGHKNLIKGNKLRIAGLTNLTFDLSVLDIFLCFSTGGCYVLINDEEIKYPLKIWRRIFLEKVNFIQTVPTLFLKLIEYLESIPEYQSRKLVKSIKIVILAGENLHSSLVKRWFKFAYPACILLNMYGPTETIHVTAKQITINELSNYKEFIPIGKPISGIKIFLLDENRNIVKDGELGEIVIFGKNIGRGYLNNNSMDENGFQVINLPLSKTDRGFVTGDIAYKDSEGNFVFKGRKDDQVKISGHRVNLSELENIALAYPDVSSAAFVCYVDSNYNYKLSLFLEDKKGKINLDNFTKWINLQLPQYARLISIYLIKDMPITKNGKIDKKSLHLRFQNIKKNRASKNLHNKELTGDQSYFIIREKLGKFEQEHPQATIIIPKIISYDEIKTKLLSLVFVEERLKYYSKDGTVTVTNIIPLDVINKNIENSILEYNCGDNIEVQLKNLIKEISGTLLSFDNWPAFRLGFFNTNHQCILTFRCHHASAGGGDVLRFLNYMFGDNYNYSVENSPGFNIPLKVSANYFPSDDIKTFLYENELEKRWLIYLNVDVFNRLKSHFTNERLTFNAGLLMLYSKTLYELKLSVIEQYIEMPLDKNRNVYKENKIKESQVTQLPQLYYLPLNYYNEPDIDSFRFYYRNLKKRILCSKEYFKHRWNFMPINDYMTNLNDNNELIPLDLFEQLPPMQGELFSSVLVQISNNSCCILLRLKIPKYFTPIVNSYCKNLHHSLS